MTEVERVCPWWFCQARLNEWCRTPQGKHRDPHLLRMGYVRLIRWWRSRP